MDNSNPILNKLTAIESLLEATRKTKPFTLVEAAKFLDLSRSHLYKLTSEPRIPHFKLNVKKIYFDKSELVLWLKRTAYKNSRGNGRKSGKLYCLWESISMKPDDYFRF